MNKDFLRRLRIYFIGVLLGLVVVTVLFFRDDSRDLDIWTPEQRILEDIRNDKVLQQSDRMKCFQECLELSDEEMTNLWTDSKTKSLNPGGNPYKYLISLADAESHLEAEVHWDKKTRTLIYIRDKRHPADCHCDE